MQGNPSNSHSYMSAFATAERRRREELLAIRKQDRDRQQAQTTDEPVVEPPAEQQDLPPHLFIESALLPAQTELSSSRPERSVVERLSGLSRSRGWIGCGKDADGSAWKTQSVFHFSPTLRLLVF